MGSVYDVTILGFKLIEIKDVVRSSAKRSEKPVDDVWWAGITRFLLIK